MARKKHNALRRAAYIAAALLLAGAAGLAVVGDRYRAELCEEYERHESFARDMLAEEKAWIKLNQGSEGEIYLNHTNAEAAGDVNPYFACQAAMGLLAGAPASADIDAAKRYLAWHTRALIIEDGEISNYRLDGDELVPTGERDSVDSYISVYLTLLAEYERKSGSLDIPGVYDALELCAERLEELENDGLLQVSSDNATQYLMDNAEALEGCRAAADMLEGRGQQELRARLLAIAAGIEEAMPRRLWQSDTGMYAVGIDGHGELIPASERPSKVYPDGIAQLYPTLCGLRDGSNEADAALYRSFCENFGWERFELEGTSFVWACVSYAAMRQNDPARAETFLRELRLRYSEARDYPFHTAESGWAARSLAALRRYYDEKQKISLWDGIVWKLKGIRE